MACLEHDIVIRDIAQVLMELNHTLGVIDYKREFSGKEVIRDNREKYRRATQSAGFLCGMLKKLDDEALVQMYKDCRSLANKYNLRSKSSMIAADEITFSSAEVETEIYNVDVKANIFKLFTMGWEHGAPQEAMGYAGRFDHIANNMGFNIHGTRFIIYDNKITLRLWKGFYGLAVGGEIGFYGSPRRISNKDIKGLLAETIKKFLNLLGVKGDADELLKLSPEALEQRLNELLLSSEQLKVDSGQRKDTRDVFIKKLTEILLGSGPLTIKFNLLFPLFVLPAGIVTLSFIVRTVQLIRFIVELAREVAEDGKEFDSDWGHSLRPEELRSILGLTGTTMQVFKKSNNKLVTEHREYEPEFWTTSFVINPARMTAEQLGFNIKNQIYTVNHFYFEDKTKADKFHYEVGDYRLRAEAYEHNGSTNKKEHIYIPEKNPNDTTVIIVYGKEE